MNIFQGKSSSHPLLGTPSLTETICGNVDPFSPEKNVYFQALPDYGGGVCPDF